MATSKMPDLRAHPLMDIDVEKIEPEGLRQKSRDLKEMFPQLPVLYITCALMTFEADAPVTAAFFMGEPPTEFSRKVMRLKKYFPASDEKQIQDVLIADKGDEEAACLRLQVELPQEYVSPNVKEVFKDATKRDTLTLSKGHYECPAGSTLELNPLTALVINREDDWQGDQRQSAAEFGRAPEVSETLQEPFPRLGLVCCEKAIKNCNGNESDTFDLLGEGKRSHDEKYSRTSMIRHKETSSTSSQGSNFDANAKKTILKAYLSPVTVEGSKQDDGPSSKITHKANATNHFKSLFPKASVDECIDVLQRPVGNEQLAFVNTNTRSKVFGELPHASTFGDFHHHLERGSVSLTESCSLGRRKRLPETCHNHASKKTHLGKAKNKDAWVSDTDEENVEEFGAEEDDKDNKDDEDKGHIAPATKWLTHTYPQTSGVTLYLGKDGLDLRNNVPAKVLSHHFNNLRHAIEAATMRDGPSEIKIELPYINADIFDLAMQYFVCGNITVAKNASNEELISTMLELIVAATLLDAPKLGALNGKMGIKIMSILGRDYLALKGQHIREAYAMKQNAFFIRDVFISVAAKRFVLDKDDHIDSDFEDDEDVGMSSARRMAYSGSGFVFYSEMRDIREFEEAVWKRARKCLAGREKVIIRARRGNAPEISKVVFTDPLTQSRLILD